MGTFFCSFQNGRTILHLCFFIDDILRRWLQPVCYQQTFPLFPTFCYYNDAVFLSRHKLCMCLKYRHLTNSKKWNYWPKVILCFQPCLMACWRRQWQPTPVLLPGKSHGQRSLEGCSPRGRWESDTTERLHFHFSLSCIGEGNGNPLQYSCLENPSMGSHRVGHD